MADNFNIIIRAISGFFYVKTPDGSILECRARGKFKKDGIVPLVGDHVLIRENVITAIEKRKNCLIRPAVANIDKLIIVISAERPRPDFLLIDKLILFCNINNIIPVICINKTDIKDDSITEQIKNEYSLFKTIFVSAYTKSNLSSLKNELHNSQAAFAGQSAVGKTSILNKLCPGYNSETAGLTKKMDRGKQTTRKCELLYNNDFSGFIIDTPGFSSFDDINIEPEKLKLYYPEFTLYNNKCRYLSCFHRNEPECAVINAVKEGLISEGRYLRYLKLLELLKEKREKKYD